MKSSVMLRCAVFASILSACASPQSRIKRHQAEFDAYPTAVQQKIRDGQADVGFTSEQVALALGRPDRRYTRKAAAATQEVWVYGYGSGVTSVGLGFGMASRGLSAFGGGV